MRIAAVATLAAALALALAGPASAQSLPACPGADTPAARDAQRAESAVLCIVDAERAARGLPALARDARLDVAAQRHSDDMAARRYFAHDSPEGEDAGDRAAAADYPYSWLYENIALGHATARAAMTGWMRSPGHCRAVLAPEVVDLGVGVTVVRGGPYWTQVFGLPAQAPPPSADGGPAQGCPYARLSIAPGPVDVVAGARRIGANMVVFGRLDGQGAGRRIVVEVRRGGRVARRRARTSSNGAFTVRIVAPRGRGRVRVTVTAPGVSGVYATGRATLRV